MEILATGRLGLYRGDACLHLYYGRHLSALDITGFRDKAAQYKESTLDRPWVLPPQDKPVPLSFEDDLLRALTNPTDAELVTANSNARPGRDWKCPNAQCLMFNHSFSKACVRCKHPRIPLPPLLRCRCQICARLQHLYYS